MDHEIELEVFRAGDYGPRGTYAEQDLEQIASDYAPERHEAYAPVTVDHQQEGPALGWVRGLRRAGRLLLARLNGLDGAFLGKLKAGTFKKRSVEIYRRLETTGRPYLRALTFLGAAAPVVKGLADPVFAEAAENEAPDQRVEQPSPVCGDPVWIAFEELADQESAAQEGISSDMAAVEEQRETPTLFGVPEPCSSLQEENPNSPAFPASMSGGDQSASMACALQTATFVEVDASTEKFCEELRKEGRLLPVWEEKGIGRFLSALDDATPLSFSDAPDAPKVTARAWFSEFLKSLDPAIPMGEMTADTPDGPALFGEPTAIPENWHGAQFDEDSVALHRRVCRYRHARPGAGYAEALQAVFVER